MLEHFISFFYKCVSVLGPINGNPHTDKIHVVLVSSLISSEEMFLFQRIALIMKEVARISASHFRWMEK